ncbi:GNAT family N-acetyltransferase [Jeotgalibacillus salarius]|uniref:GNAT family N-acetyltransferase n=1 Tax=Jeotgalibacillus salarius TaxID=546023 RepID=A0A4Y8LIC1_9BACL|nr:GNAT family N-acetyltransferase [Jeotgalibacillus salarius]TFE02121.1 GNAT family N-acetyltransferase [Jeotgalibacillus salarius]
MELYQGEAVRKPDGTKVQYIIRQMTENQFDEFNSFQHRIATQLEDQTSLQPLTDEEIQYVLGDGGILLGVYAEDQLIAARALLFPGDDEENLGRDLGLSYDEQMRVVHQEISLVAPEYRGNGLQQTMAKVIMQELKFTNTYFEHVCCTVSPANLPSMRDKFKQEMVVVDVKDKYGNMPRYIFYKPLKQKIFVDKDSYIFVRTDKTDRQKDFMASGYVGVGISRTPMGVWLAMARLKESV